MSSSDSFFACLRGDDYQKDDYDNVLFIFREILMTASANIKTPTMDVLVKPGCEQEAKNLVKSLNKLVLMQVCDSHLRM